MDRVYYDTGDILVTARRVAFEGVSAPLAGVTAARVERIQETWVVPGFGPDRQVRWWELVAVQLILVGIAVGGMSYTYTILTVPGVLPLVSTGVLAYLLVCSIVLWATHFPDVRRRRLTVTWHAAILVTGRGSEIELFRTRHPAEAAEVVDAVNRARTDASPDGV